MKTCVKKGGTLKNIRLKKLKLTYSGDKKKE